MKLQRDRIDAAIAPLGLGTVVVVTPLAGGTTAVFRLDLSSDVSVVLKLGVGSGKLDTVRETFAAQQLRGLAIPVARVLMADESRRHLPAPFVLTTYLPGVTGGSLRDHADIASLYRQTGALLRMLHGVPMPAFGSFGAEGIRDPLPSNEQFLHRLIDDAVVQFRRQGGDQGLADRLYEILDADFEAVVVPSRGPVFAHDDLHPNNVLAVEDEEGRLRLSGLVDFGNARAADPVFDLAKCLFCSEHDAPGSTPHILAGYGAVDHPEPQRALRYYTILHRMIMWWWLRQIGVIPSPAAPSELMWHLRACAGG